MDWEKTTARGYKKHLSFGIWCDLYKRFYGSFNYIPGYQITTSFCTWHNNTAAVYRPFVMEIHQWLENSLHEGPGSVYSKTICMTTKFKFSLDLYHDGKIFSEMESRICTFQTRWVDSTPPSEVTQVIISYIWLTLFIIGKHCYCWFSTWH